MAIGAATVWRVRPGGDNNNGAAFDATISGAGTDYSQQDAAQLSLTDLVCQASDDAGRLKLRSATGGFTSAMIGNAVRILSTGTFTAGYYFIVGYDSTNLVTLDRSPAGGADRTGGSGKVGGAAATWQRVATNGSATGDKVVPGNTVYIRGAGSSFPTSADYTSTGYTQAVSGDTTNGYVRFIGENGRPRIDTDGLVFYNTNYCLISGIYFYATSNNELANNGFASGQYRTLFGNVFDLNDKNGPCISTVSGAYGTRIYFNEFFSKASAPTAQTAAKAIRITGLVEACDIRFNHIHHMGDAGISLDSGSDVAAIIEHNVIHHCKSHGIVFQGSVRPNDVTTVAHNTIDANEGDGINVQSAAALAYMAIFNNILSNHTGSGKSGINVAAGTAATNDRIVPFCDYNAFYNNTAHRTGISAGANDQTGVDPGYVGANDYRIGTALKALGFPIGDYLEAASGSRSFTDIGAFQREEAASGGGMIVHPGMKGRLV